MSQLKFSTVMLKQQNLQFFGRTSSIVSSQQVCLQHTAAATVASKIVDSERSVKDAQIELENARPYNEIPTLGTFEFVRAYMPGGKFYNMDSTETMKAIAKNFGEIARFPSIFGTPPIVITHNANDFECVFRNEGIWPTRPGSETLGYHRSKHQSDFYKGIEGLISTQGEQWGKFRSIVNPVLLQPKNVRLYLQKMSNVNREFIERIRKIRDPVTNEMPANFEDEINRWTLESVSVVALDRQLGLLKSDDIEPEVKNFFDRVSEFFVLSGDLDTKPSLWKIVATPKFKRLMNVFNEIQNTTSNFVNEAIHRLEQEQKEGKEKPENEKSVLEKLLKIDQKVAIVMAMDMLMAGVDTTTTTFTGTMLCLAKNPEKQAKLREEILRILPEKDSEFTEKSLNDMSYLRACIKEALRVYPLAVGNARVVQRDVVLSGYRVPKGTQVMLSAALSNEDEKYFPRPNEFLPERWLRASKAEGSTECPNELKLNNPFVYLPFGFGPRSCIGRRIAELELELGVARIIRNFNVAYNHPMEKPFKSVLINVPNIPLKFQFTDI